MRLSNHVIDKKFICDVIRHLNQRWIESAQKIQSRVQMLESTICELKQYREHLDVTSVWIDDVIDTVVTMVPMTLSVEDLIAVRQKHSVSTI